MQIEDANGNRVTVTEAHWNRWPQLAKVFRPVAGNQEVATVTDEQPPTGAQETEN